MERDRQRERVDGEKRRNGDFNVFFGVPLNKDLILQKWWGGGEVGWFRGIIDLLCNRR